MTRGKILPLLFIIAVSIIITSCSLDETLTPTASQPLTSNQPPAVTRPVSDPPSTHPVIPWGKRTKTTGCKVRGPLPDPACTPGDLIKPLVTRDDICVSGYSSGVRDVSTSLKEEVYKTYGIKKHSPAEYEIDHFVSLGLGGSNDISNLFPEAAEPRPGYHEKDEVENYLIDQVCEGAMSLEEAQSKIATNWVEVFNSIPK
jgi:hypothetical protein